METLYRKVILNIVDRCFHMYASDYRKEAKESAIKMLEEIPDTSHQLEKLEAEKKELLHFLKYFKQCVEDEDFIMVNNTDEDVVDNVLSKMNSLIQKHKS